MRYLFILFSLLSFNSFSQIKITGQVIDRGNPVILATIDVVGKNISNVTDDSGVFYLNLPAAIKRGDIVVLRVSKKGYNTLTKQVAVSYLSIPIKLTKSVKRTSAKININNSKTESEKEHGVIVTSYNQTGGITANQVNIGTVPRTLNSETKKHLLEEIPNKNQWVVISSVWGDSESFQFATEIEGLFKEEGYKNVELSQVTFNKPIKGEVLFRDSANRVQIIIGSRQ